MGLRRFRNDKVPQGLADGPWVARAAYPRCGGFPVRFDELRAVPDDFIGRR